MKGNLSAVKPSLSHSAILALILVLESTANVVGQQINETPGVNKKNHTAFVFAPYRWASSTRNEPSQWVKTYVSDMPSEEEAKAIGQQYSYMEMQELMEPTKDMPARVCTVPHFRDLLMNNKDDMGVLAIFTHGGNKDFAVEPFGKDAGATQRRDEAYKRYTTAPAPDKPPEFTTDEINKFDTPDDGPAIGVTAAFIQKYRQMGQALVVIGACMGNTSAPLFVEAFGQAMDRRARVALGAMGCPKKIASNLYLKNFFGDLDGYLPKTKTARSDQERLLNRAVGAALAAENKEFGRDPNFPVTFGLAGLGNTTLAPRVKEGTDFGVPCPITVGTSQIQIVLDTNANTSIVPGKEDIETEGITVGQPKWKDGSKNILQIPVIGPAPNAVIKTFSFKLKGDKMQSAMNVATLDGNTNPDELNPDGSGVNAKGPANSQKTPDSYFVKFEDCKRKH